MPVSLQTLKPAADRANPRIGIGALAFSPDNCFLATRSGQWPVHVCVLSPHRSLGAGQSNGLKGESGCGSPARASSCPAAEASRVTGPIGAAAAQPLRLRLRPWPLLPLRPSLGRSRAQADRIPVCARQPRGGPPPLRPQAASVLRRERHGDSSGPVHVFLP